MSHASVPRQRKHATPEAKDRAWRNADAIVRRLLESDDSLLQVATAYGIGRALAARIYHAEVLTNLARRRNVAEAVLFHLRELCIMQSSTAHFGRHA